VKISTRLKNALKSNYSYHPEAKFEYLEDINKKDFDRIRNSGEVTWNELKSLIDTYKPVPRGIYYLPTKDN
jgi:hypothetical protein